MLLKFSQQENAFSIDVTVFGTTTLVKLSQLKNAEFIVVTLLGIDMLSNPVKLNTLLIDLIFPGIVTRFRLGQNSNAHIPIDVTLSGIVTFCKLVH